MELPPGSRLAHFEIVAQIGAGGMGQVYKARDTRLDRTVAIKVLSDATAEQKERFEREGKAVAALQHPHICALYDIGRHEGVDFLVMEHLEGQTLAEKLKRGPLPLSECLRYAGEIADALDQAHRRGVIHRDLKPANVMLTSTGTKLLDFGLAKVRAPKPAAGADDDTLTAGLTRIGAVMGTAPYMSPEQVEGKETDARSDLFSYGAMLYEMLTGGRAFPGRTASSVMVAVMEHDPPPIAPRSLDWLLRGCLAKDPEERWQTARELARMLRNVEDEPEPPRSVKRSAIPWAIAAAFALALAGTLGWRMSRKPPEPEAVRFLIQPGAGETLGYPQISPDGRKLAMVVSGAKRQLRVRSLDSVAVQPLADTDSALAYGWSPDSRYLVFLAKGKLRKIDIQGGPAQALADARSPASPPGRLAWSRDGTILFNDSGTGRGMLLRVSASGGVPAAVAENASYPQFLPGGGSFLFNIQTGRSESAGSYAARLDNASKDRKLILPQVINSPELTPFAFAPPDRILFLRDSTLMSQEFDPEKFELRGEPSVVAQPVSSYSVSANGVLAYSAGRGLPSRKLAWFNRKGEPLGGSESAQSYAALALSPDGKRIAVGTRMDPNVSRSNLDIWVLESVGGVSSRLTFDSGFSPIWSPDGARIVFARIEAPQNRLYSKTSNGAGGEEPLDGLVSPITPVDWSRDGRYLLYVGRNPKTTVNNLWVHDFQSKKSTPYLETTSNETLARFSPDGRWIAYTSDGTKTNEVYVQSFPPSGGKWQVSTGGGVAPAWRADGKELFYLTEDCKVMSVPVKTGQQFEAGKAVELFASRLAFTNLLAGYTYAVSADGQRFLMPVPAVESTPEPVTVVLNWRPGLK